MRGIGAIIGIILVLTAISYSGYWVAKTVSYNIFYEDMVRDTVREMVKTTALLK